MLAILKSKTPLDSVLNIDRLGNALAAGDYKTTISGRVGYFALTKSNPYWLLLQWIIDETFRPYEGVEHCLRAFMWESGRDLSHRRGNDIALGLLSVFVILGCLILAPIVWLWSKVRRVS